MSGGNKAGKQPATWQDDNAMHSSFSSTGSHGHVQFDENVHGDASRRESHSHLVGPNEEGHHDNELRRRRYLPDPHMPF